MKNILFLTLLLSQFCLVSAQKFENKMDSLISSEFKETESPGLVFLVAKNGKPIYEKAIGKANLELNVDMATNQVFQIASMTKQFTAVAVLMLEEQGKLSVNDAVSKYIPDYPNGNNITLHHLLNHTSGIKDFTKIKALKDISQKEMTPKMMVDFFKNEKVDFLWDTVPVEFKGDDKQITSIDFKNVKTGEVTNAEAEGVFVYIGLDPLTEPFKDLGITNEEGWIVTNEHMETNIPGIYAIGDVRDTVLRQIATAVGDGSIAGQEVYKYITELDD